MARIRIARKDDSKEVAEQTMTHLLRRYKTVRFLFKPLLTENWDMEWPDGREWTRVDADFMNDLAHNRDLLAGWRYHDW